MGIIFKEFKKKKTTHITPQRSVVQKYIEKLFLSYPSMPLNDQTGIPAGVSFLLRGCCKVCFHCLHTWRFLWNVQDLNRHVETSSGELLPFWPNYIFLGIANTASLLSCNPAGLLQEKFTVWVSPPASPQSYPKWNRVTSYYLKIFLRERENVLFNMSEGKFPIERREKTVRENREETQLNSSGAF